MLDRLSLRDPSRVLAALVFCTAAITAQATPAIERVELPGNTPFDVYANHPLSGDLANIEEVVFVVHGVQRDGNNYFDAAESVAEAIRLDQDRVLIVAPNFFNTSDSKNHRDLDGLPLWDKTAWMQGDAAVRGPPVSSFAAFDELLAYLSDKKRLPQLKRIVIAGHSGGAQFVDRYAALNHADEPIRALGIDLSYVIANPSSYLYTTPDRPSPGGFSPYSRAVCPDYDQYRYGMQDMVPYAGNPSGQQVFDTFAARHVTFLWGTNDVDPNHRALDKSCGAEAQGPTRYVRGHSYWTYEHGLKSGVGLALHHAFDVVGVGHDQARMFGSTCGVRLLFGDWAGSKDAQTDQAACVAVPSPG